MRYTEFSEKNSSRIILGTAYFGDGIGEKESFELIDKFCELGGTHIDTARLYAEGASEEIVGKWLKSRKPKDIFVSTKGGFPVAANPDKVRISEEEIRSDLEKSMKALSIDTLDFYWLHRDDETIPAEVIIDMMNTLVKEGKIKAFGASNWTSQRIKTAQEYARRNGLMGFGASQIRFNPATIISKPTGLVGMDKDEFKFYESENMKVFAYSSQAKGFFSKMAEMGEDAVSPKAKERYLSEGNLKKLETLKNLSEKYNCSIASLICAAFCSFEHPTVFPVIGCSKTTQLVDSIVGADIQLSIDEIEQIFEGVIK